MRQIHFLVLFALISLAGCGATEQETTQDSINVTQPAETANVAKRKATSPKAGVSTADEELPKPEDESVQAVIRKSVGRLEFAFLPGWETRATKIAEGIVMFAPDRDEWKAIGFRPNLSVRVRQNPGMQLDDLESTLREVLGQNVAALNSQMLEEAKSVLETEGTTLSITGVKFSLERSQLQDDFPCLNTISDGGFKLNGKFLRTKTFSLAVLDTDHIYTAAITMPIGHEQEMAKAWIDFCDSVRYRKGPDEGG